MVGYFFASVTGRPESEHSAVAGRGATNASPDDTLYSALHSGALTGFMRGSLPMVGVGLVDTLDSTCGPIEDTIGDIGSGAELAAGSSSPVRANAAASTRVPFGPYFAGLYREVETSGYAGDSTGSSSSSELRPVSIFGTSYNRNRFSLGRKDGARMGS